MTRTPYAGGLYVDAYPTGEYVVLYPNSRVETNLAGRVAFPAGETYGPMFLKMSPTKDRFCGLAHDTPPGQGPTLLEWVQASGWRPVPTVTGRVVYDGAGVIRDTLPAGYQFVRESGELMSRLDTYGPTNGLSEWCEVADLQIGQGHDSITPPGQGGVIVWDGAAHRRLDEGTCTFINAHRFGDHCAISYVKSGEGAVIVGATLSELRALPLLVTPPLPPQPPEPPMPKPVPNEAAFVKVFLAPRLKQLGSLDATRANTFEAVNACCNALRSRGDVNWGLLEKLSGDRVKDRAADILLYAIDATSAQVVDVVVNAEGDGGQPLPGWGIKDIRPIGQWRQPYATEPDQPPPPDNPPPDNPPPPPPQPSVDLTPLWEAIARLQGRVETLEHRPAGKTPVLVSDAAGTEFSTGSNWGHNHKIKLRIEER